MYCCDCFLLLLATVKSPLTAAAAAAAQARRAAADQTVLPPSLAHSSSSNPILTSASDTAGSQSALHKVEVGPPILYSVFYETQGLAEAAGLNLRASWLACRRVYGPALFAGSGILRGAVSSLEHQGLLHILQKTSSCSYWQHCCLHNLPGPLISHILCG